MNLLKPINKIKRVINIISRYVDVSKRLNQTEKKYTHFFFFEGCGVGGADRVHIDIMKSIEGHPSLCFIEWTENGTGFYDKFAAVADLLILQGAIHSTFFRKLMLKKIASVINNSKDATIFGCNSRFFYELLPFLREDIRKVDMIHAFTDIYIGPEHYSLPVIDRIDHRILLGNFTKKELELLYKKNKVNKSLLDRIKIIPNKTSIPRVKTEKKFDENLKLLFVGRNVLAKRIHLINEIAIECFHKSLPVEFTVVGYRQDEDNSGLCTVQWDPRVTVIGELNDSEVINSLYRQAHLILITSSREGFPMVIMEGMAYGVVPISTNVGEISEFIGQQFENGFLVENESEELIVKHFVSIIEHLAVNRDILKSFSSNAEKFAADNFNDENFNKSYRTLLLN